MKTIVFCEKDFVKFRIITAALLMAACCQNPSAAQFPAPQISDLFAAYSQADLFSGAVLVARNGQVLFREAYGMADRELDVPMEPQMKFRIGSLTKPFTATLILQLAGQGLLQLDDPVTKHLPEYQGSKWDEITVEQLLSHTSGIIRGPDPVREAELERMPHSLPELVRIADTSDLCFEPGTGFYYSNLGYQVLALIAERVCQAPYECLLEERIFRPLGMLSTRSHKALHIEKDLVKGYEYRLLTGYENAAFIDPSFARGAGDVVSTVDDLHTFCLATGRGQLISGELYRMMVTPSTQASYGFGWELSERIFPAMGDTVRIISHSGSINGFGAYMAWVQEDSLFICVLKNFRSDTYIAPSYAPRIGQEILSIVYNEPVALPQRSVARHLGRIIGEQGIEAAVTAYRRIRESGNGEFNMEEAELNRLGIELIFRFGMPDEALEIFELNMQAYPLSYNTYDSYAYALRELGDYPNAVIFYRKGLKILETYPQFNREKTTGEEAKKAVLAIEEMEKALAGGKTGPD